MGLCRLESTPRRTLRQFSFLQPFCRTVRSALPSRQSELYTTHGRRPVRGEHVPKIVAFGEGVMPDKRILLVEDEPEIQQLLAHVLRAAGYAVDTAGSAEQAWQRLRAAAYGAVIADWRLPDGDGSLILDWAA